jgi:hypothetical protein
MRGYLGMDKRERIRMVHMQENTSPATGYTRRTDDQLRQLARDIFQNKVFTDRHLADKDRNLLGTVFLSAGLMNADTPEWHRIFGNNKDAAKLLYQYMDKKLPLPLRGYPVFQEFDYLNREDMDRMYVFFKELHEQVHGAAENKT